MMLTCARLLLGLLLLSAPACDEARKKPAAPAWELPPGTYADGPDGLTRLFQDVLAACKKDDRGRVHDLLASMVMGREELAGLIGPERATALWPRYQALAGSMANIGAVELVATVYEKKYDDVVVTRVDQLPPAQMDPGDRDALAAMVRKLPLYTVRIKRKTEPSGVRYNFFFYQEGHWRTGNQLGKYLGTRQGRRGAAAARRKLGVDVPGAED